MLYKNFNKIFLKTILIIFISYRINAKNYDCLTLCCPCFFENNSKDEGKNEPKDDYEKISENKNNNKSEEKREIEKFLNEYKSNKIYKKGEKTKEKSSIQPNYENYIGAFNDIDKKLGHYFKDNSYEFCKMNGFYYNSLCLFSYFKNNKIKDILQVGDYLVTFDTEKVDQSDEKFIEDLNEALRIEEDDEIKFLSEVIKDLKTEKNYDNGDYSMLKCDLYIFSIRDNKYIGGIEFKPLKRQNKTPLIFNIVYWLNYNYRGLGIMSVIVPTICKYFFIRIKEIEGYTFSWDKGNSKSAGLAKKTCNFIRTGHEKEYEIDEEAFIDVEAICITKNSHEITGL